MNAHRKLAAVLAAVTLSLAGTAAIAQQTQAPAATAAAPSTQRLLAGELTFKLPAGFSGSELPKDAGVPGGNGWMYMNPTSKQVIVISDTPAGAKVEKNDPVFLKGVAEGLATQQKRASPSYSKKGESDSTVGKLGVKRIDATTDMGGKQVLVTTFLAASGDRLTTISAYSGQKDGAAHEALNKAIAGNLSAN